MKKIYVGNLSYDATEDDLRSAFGQYGEVTSVAVITDRETGRPRGFAFVEMSDDKAGDEAIQGLNLAEIAGRAINVNEARPKTQGAGGFGGGNRGGQRRSW